MNRKAIIFIALAVIAGSAVLYFWFASRPRTMVLTGLVTTNDVIVSSQIAGQIDKLLVTEGNVVKHGDLLVVIKPDELQADAAYYAHSAEGVAEQVKEGEAALRYQQRQTTDQIKQAEAVVSSVEAQRAAAEADAENARLIFERSEGLKSQGILSQGEYDQARTTYAAAQAKVDSFRKQADAQRATLALARANAEQNAVRLHQLDSSRQEQAAAAAQRTKADVRLAYTELRAPIGGLVDVRAVRAGEVVAAGQPLLTLINPDDLWVRADVEETYVDHVRLGDRLTVRLPSGKERPGVVFYRAADAAFATQRDVSRSKRDIKTFEIRLRVDNRDRGLAVGMTAYVILPPIS
ncbi:MAG TPA: HlyD family efflux transporter periplasmic adaptor subunit [Candidatus Polarisedimenticolia bacterium]|jgi:HlyD family secretion protein|nr:HlyD family efflux transporter periplasmic adaptor subunit [Candidatus Polarisedimenticolia bacterium]